MIKRDRPAESSGASSRKRPLNPVFEHLTRRRRWPTVRVSAILLAALSGGGCLWVLLAALTVEEAALRVLSISLIALPLGSLMLALVSPFLAGMIAAIGTVRDADADLLQLLRLTNLTPREIVNGYVWVALYRLRLLWAICFGLLPPLCGSIAVIIGTPLVYQAAWELMEYAGPAFWIVFCGAALGTGLNWLAVCAGVRAALRWRRIGPAAGAAAGAALAALIGLMGALFCGFRAIFDMPDAESAGTVFVILCLTVAGLYVAVGYANLQSARGAL